MTIGSIAVNIVAKTNKLVQPMQRATKLMAAFTNQVKRATVAVVVMGAALTAAFTGAAFYAFWKFYNAFRAGGKGGGLDLGLANQLTRANKALDKLFGTFTKLTAHIAAYLAPMIEAIATHINNTIDRAGSLPALAKKIAETFMAVIKAVLDGVQAAILEAMKMLQAVRVLLFKILNSGLMRKLGMGFTDEEGMRAFGEMTRGQEAVDEFAGRRKASEFLETSMDKIFKELVQDAVKPLFKVLSEKLPTVADGINKTQGALRNFANTLKLGAAKAGSLAILAKSLGAGPVPALKKFTTETHNKPLKALEAGTQEARLAMRGKTDTTSQKILKTNEDQVRLAEIANEQLRKLAGPLLGFGIE